MKTSQILIEFAELGYTSLFCYV